MDEPAHEFRSGEAQAIEYTEIKDQSSLSEADMPIIKKLIAEWKDLTGCPYTVDEMLENYQIVPVHTMFSLPGIKPEPMIVGFIACRLVQLTQAKCLHIHSTYIHPKYRGGFRKCYENFVNTALSLGWYVEIVAEPRFHKYLTRRMGAQHRQSIYWLEGKKHGSVPGYIPDKDNSGHDSTAERRKP